MSDIEAIQAQILGEIEAAVDANAVEALRVAALGKAGSITALLKTLGGMGPEERQAQGPAIPAPREEVTAEIGARERKGAGWGKGGSGRVAVGGGRDIKKK